MKFFCRSNVVDINGSSFSRTKAKESLITLYENKGEIYLQLTFVTSKISGNICRLYTSHLNDGFITIRIQNPKKDIMLQESPPSNLIKFSDVLIQIQNGRKISGRYLSYKNLADTEVKNVDPKHLTINNRENYPMGKGFNHALEILVAKELKLRLFDTRILKLSHLSILDLSSNLIQNVPQEIGNLKLKTLDLNNNQISQWPTICATCPLIINLEHLNLAHNQIEWIPDDFWNFLNLITIDLSHNQLRGLPAYGLHKLSRLSVLLLNDNKLDCLPYALIYQHPTRFDVSNNLFLLPINLSSPANDVPSLLHIASTLMVRTKCVLEEDDTNSSTTCKKPAKLTNENKKFVKDVSNPIYATRCGQEALQELLSGLRDLMLSFYACMVPKHRGVLSSHHVFAATPQCLEMIQLMKNNRENLRQAFNIVKESCDRLLPKDNGDLIPYIDSTESVKDKPITPELKQLLDTREQAAKRLLDVTNELEKLRQKLSNAIWELNDLSDPSVQRF